MAKTTIAWTEFSCNPVTGCTHAGTPECDHCYARAMAHRLKAMGIARYTNGFTPTTHPEVLKEIAQIPSGSMVFLPSMSDLFHDAFSDDYISDVVAACEAKTDVTFQFLTKRIERMAEFFNGKEVPNNIWTGVTIGHDTSLFRLDSLKQVNSKCKWISAEPLLSDIASKLDLSDINWVVVGGESGPGARKMEESWVWNLKVATEKAGAAFFFKQWGSIGNDGVRRRKKDNGCELKGKVYKEYPIVT